MNNDLRYRESIIKTKRRWDELIEEARYSLYDSKEEKIFAALFKQKIIGDDIKSIIQEKQKELGIYGGALALLSKAMGAPYLLYSPKLQSRYNFKSDIDDYEFLDTPYDLEWKDGRDGYRYFIDLLFFIARSTDRPEYIENIKHPDRSPFEYDFQFAIRKSYEILHCSGGEVLFFLFFWRIIILGIQISKNAKTKVSEVDFGRETKEQLFSWEEVFQILQADCIEKDILKYFLKVSLPNEQNDDIGKAIKVSLDELERVSREEITDYQKILRNIGFFKTANTRHFTEFNRYARHVFNNEDFALTQTFDSAYPKKFLLEIVKLFFPGKPDVTLEELLIALHQKARFPVLPYYFLMAYDEHKTLKEHLVFPIWYTFSPTTQYEYGKDKEHNESAVIHGLYTIKPIWELDGTTTDVYDAENDNGEFITHLNDIIKLFNVLSKPIIDKEYYAKQRNNDIDVIKKQAIKAAISQVMARNMSHNIGSHVLSKFKSREDILNPVLKQYKSFFDSEAADPLTLVAVFNEYLKNRMDYLADIATSDPVMENAMELKAELLAGIDKNRALLDRISGVSDEELQFQFDVTQNGAFLEADISLSMTNDILGAHAFYIILENIIRNIAKHSKLGENEKNITITIDVTDYQAENKDTGFYQVAVFDNVRRTNKEIEEIVIYRNQSFNSSILVKNVLRDNNLGTIEMDVSAAYLRGLPVSSIESPEFNLTYDKLTGEVLNNGSADSPLLIYAYRHPVNENESVLGYKFHINKPKEVLVIDDEGDFHIADLTSSELDKKGIKVIRTAGLSYEDVFNHQLIYFHTPALIEPDLYYNIPKRVAHKIEEDAFKSVIHFRALVWEKYISAKKTIRFPVEIDHENWILILGCSNAQLENLMPEQTAGFRVLIDQNHASSYNKQAAYDYYDMFCGHHKNRKYRDNLFKLGSDFRANNSLIRKSEYLEVVFAKLVVIDERMQENIANQKKLYSGSGNSFTYQSYFKKQQVYIPEKEEADLNQLDFGAMEMLGTVSNNLKKYLQSAQFADADFFVIHLGIIEKLLPPNTIKSRELIDGVLNELFPAQRRTKIVVTSGRGNPNNLPEDIAFLPIALIQNAIETSYDKLLLTKILYNSRTAKK